MTGQQDTLGRIGIRERIADALALVHTAIVTFFALGWALPWADAWWLVVVGGFGLQAVWCVFRNECPLTLLEAWLRGQSASSGVEGAPQPHFLASLLTRMLGREVSNFVGDLVAYAVLYTSMALAAWRLWG